MSGFVAFENKGEVPVNAFKLLGASSKRNDSGKIGYFGTGLKYAIAVLLREGIDFKIFSGESEVKIGLRKTKFFDDVVNVMTVNGEKTSITIDAGIDWEPWFAIREIYSNTIDEGGEMRLVNGTTPEKGTTKIYVTDSSAALKDVFQNWAAYFTDNRDMLFKNSDGSILPKLPTVPEWMVFRKGIRAYTIRKHSVFDYDVDSLDINESRVAKYDFQVRERCSDLLASSTKECIEQFVRLRNNPRRTSFIEWDDSFWDYTGSYSFGDAWLEVLGDKRLIPANYAGHYDITETTVVLPDKLIDKLKKRFGDAINLAGDNNDKYVVLENIDKSPLSKMLEVFSSVGFDWKLEDIDIVNFHDKDLFGMADDGRVLLSAQLFNAVNKHRVPAVLIEEIVHAKTGYSDGTRQMQSYLFESIVSLSKELAAQRSSK